MTIPETMRTAVLTGHRGLDMFESNTHLGSTSFSVCG